MRGSRFSRLRGYDAAVPRRESPYAGSYASARLVLLRQHLPCSLRLVCQGALSTTADHQPPIALHAHIPDSGCCALLPACSPCQHEQGKIVARVKASGYARPLPEPSRQW